MSAVSKLRCLADRPRPLSLPRCAYQASVTAGTLFADTHLPLRLWFEAGWHVTNQKYGASALGMQRILGLGSYPTAGNWFAQAAAGDGAPGP